MVCYDCLKNMQLAAPAFDCDEETKKKIGNSVKLNAQKRLKNVMKLWQAQAMM